MCLTACPYYTITSTQTCYMSCPNHLGYTIPGAGTECTACTVNSQKATFEGCVTANTSCPQTYPMLFGQGCFAACPQGLLIGATSCSEPSVLSDCSSTPFPLLIASRGVDGNQFFNTCDYNPPIQMYQVMVSNVSTNVYTGICIGTLFANLSCLPSTPFVCSSGQVSSLMTWPNSSTT